MDQPVATFWDHLDELRTTFFQSLAILVVGIAAAFWFSHDVLELLKRPINSAEKNLAYYTIQYQKVINQSSKPLRYLLPAESEIVQVSRNTQILENSHFILPPQGYLDIQTKIKPETLALLSPLEGLLVSFKISFWIGFALTSPFWGLLFLRFILPALNPLEKGLLIPFIILSIVAITGGILLAYYIAIPLANNYLIAFNTGLGTNFWSLSSYIDYTLGLMMANAVAFELCVLLLITVHLGLITPEAMRSKRRHAILGAFILATILTPPDILTQFLIAIPLIIIYELAILYGTLRARKYSTQRR